MVAANQAFNLYVPLGVRGELGAPYQGKAAADRRLETRRRGSAGSADRTAQPFRLSV
jgi:hypothetical protein